MKQLVKKEFTFTALPLCYLFLLFSGMTMIPGYPIAMGSFFLCLSLFQSMMNSREQNDLSYTLLLPVSKADVVKANYLFCVGIQLLFFLLCAVFAHLCRRMQQGRNIQQLARAQHAAVIGAAQRGRHLSDAAKRRCAAGRHHVLGVLRLLKQQTNVLHIVQRTEIARLRLCLSADAALAQLTQNSIIF